MESVADYLYMIGTTSYGLEFSVVRTISEEDHVDTGIQRKKEE